MITLIGSAPKAIAVGALKASGIKQVLSRGSSLGSPYLFVLVNTQEISRVVLSPYSDQERRFTDSPK